MYILNHYTMKTFIQCIIFAILTFTSPFLDAQEKIIACPNELQQEWANAYTQPKALEPNMQC